MAAIAEVAVTAATGKVQVNRVVCAQDMGVVINPEGAMIQLEGWVTMGLGYALTAEDHFQGGGEPAIVLMGALLANAIYDATGARWFQLPMTPERGKATLDNI